MNPRPVIAISRAVVALLAVPVVFGAGLVSAPQVHATTPAPISVSLAVEDAVRFDGCTILPVEYSFDSSRYTDWKARVSIFPEFGTTPTKTKFLSASTDESSDFSEFFICDDEATGLWRVSMYVQLYIDDDTAEEGRGSADASFTLREPQTQTSYTLSDSTPRPGQFVTFRVRSEVEKPSQLRANRLTSVALESLDAGRWTRLRGSLTETNMRGVAQVRMKWRTNTHLKVRAVTLMSANSAPSISETHIVR